MKALKKSLIFVLPVFLLIFFVTPLYGQESRVVFIVTNPNVMPYKEIIKGIREKLECPSLLIDISHDGGDRPFSKSTHFGVIAIGDKGLNEAKRLFPDSLKVAIFLGDEETCLKEPNIKCQLISLFPDPSHVFSIYKSLFPDKKKIGVLFGKDMGESYRKLVKAKAKSLHLSIISSEANNEHEMVKAISNLAQESDAFFFIPQSLFSPAAQSLLFESFFFQKKPVFSTSYRATRQGALFATIVTTKNLGEKAAKVIQTSMGKGLYNSPSIIYLKPDKTVCNKNIAKNLGIPLSKIDKIQGDCL